MEQIRFYYNRVDQGGHYAAWEQPLLFSEEVRRVQTPAQIATRAIDHLELDRERYGACARVRSGAMTADTWRQIDCTMDCDCVLLWCLGRVGASRCHFGIRRAGSLIQHQHPLN